MGECKICGKEDCYTHCQKTSDGIHIPDLKSFRTHQGETPGVIYLEFWCLHCHNSGTLTLTTPLDINW